MLDLKQLFVVEQISRFFTRQFNLLLTRINFWQQSYFRFNKKKKSIPIGNWCFRVRVTILVFRIRQRTKTKKTNKNKTQKTKTMSYTDQQQKWGWTQVLAEKGKTFLFLLRHPSCYLYQSPVKLLSLIEEREKNIRYREKIQFQLRNRYFATFNQFPMTTVYFCSDDFNLGTR